VRAALQQLEVAGLDRRIQGTELRGHLAQEQLNDHAEHRRRRERNTPSVARNRLPRTCRFIDLSQQGRSPASAAGAPGHHVRSERTP
jgi:hypothetical protein